MSIAETQHQIEQTEEQLRRLRDRLEQETIHQRAQPQEPPDPEQELKFYRWPASRITRADMIRLTDLRKLTKRPITRLIHEAVVAYHWLLSQPRLCCDKPRLAWNGLIENCSIDCASCGFVLCDDGQLADWHDPEQIAAERELAQEEHAK